MYVCVWGTVLWVIVWGYCYGFSWGWGWVAVSCSPYGMLGEALRSFNISNPSMIISIWSPIIFVDFICLCFKRLRKCFKLCFGNLGLLKEYGWQRVPNSPYFMKTPPPLQYCLPSPFFQILSPLSLVPVSLFLLSCVFNWLFDHLRSNVLFCLMTWS